MNRPLPAKVWTERYETLRGHFVENRRCLEADPLDLTLLLRNGIAGWMRTGRTCAATASEPAALAGPLGFPSTPTAWQQDLTHLIAHMTTQHLQKSSRL
jgi:hypothetical protein